MLAAPPFNLLATFDRVDEAIDANAAIAKAILRSAHESFGLQGQGTEGTATSTDIDKARSTIRQFYRDWSAEGAVERAACYEPVLKSIKLHVECSRLDKNNVSILVPGAGLGRLVFEICRSGYCVEGNEISYHQLMASNWILNHTVREQQYYLYPFAFEFSNIKSRDDQFMAVKIPDVHPGSGLEKLSPDSTTDLIGTMSMTAGDFVVLYSQPGNENKFDIVATVFFIDTAPNLIRYVEAIRNCLKTGGIWINHGPLLWHFGDRAPGDHDVAKNKKRMGGIPGIEEPGNFELSNEEVMSLVERHGFDIQSHESCNDRVGYIQNPNSMLQNAYASSHWVARKREFH